MRLNWRGVSRPLTVVQLSDLHWGNGDHQPIRKAIAEAASLRGDVTVVTGDFLDDRGTGVGGLAEALEPLRGAYAVLGDHDYDGDPEGVRRAVAQAGMRLLVNESVEVDGLWLAGVDDLERGRGDLQETLRGMPAHGGMLLSHNPLAFELLDPDLPVTILAGHTHGAQIRIPFPWPSLVVGVHLGLRTTHGWYFKGRLRLYVNRGIGCAGPWPLNRRVFCPPEVSLFKLEPCT